MQIDTVVIGAGQAGLATSWALRQAGVAHVVLERGRVGESWRAQRWDSFHLNTPNRYTGLPGTANAADDQDGFLSGREWVDLCAANVRAHGLPVREGVEVVRVRATDEGFEVRVRDGEPWTCANVVVASGIANVPKIPAVARDLDAAIEQLHAASYRSPAALPEGGVLVIGSGQSGVQIAEDLLEAGRETWLSTSLVGRAPRRYRGRDIFEWLAVGGLLKQSIADLETPAEAKLAQPQISGTQGGHTLGLGSLVRMGAKLLGRLDRIEGKVVHVRGDLTENVAFGDMFSARIRGMVDQAVEKAGLSASAPEPDPGEAPVEGLEAMAAQRSLDLGAAGIGSVIWATGFTGDFSWLDLPVLDEAGLPVHEGGVSEVPGVYFMGFPWLRTRASGLICGVEDDARHLVGHMRARAEPGA